jgi:hypothetical protein
MPTILFLSRACDHVLTFGHINPARGLRFLLLRLSLDGFIANMTHERDH